MAEVNGPVATMKVSLSADGTVDLVFAGELDIVTTESLEGELQGLLARPASKVIVDLADVAFLDSSGIALLLRIANQFGPLEVRAASAIAQRVIEVCGLSDTLRLGAT